MVHGQRAGPPTGDECRAGIGVSRRNVRRSRRKSNPPGPCQVTERLRDNKADFRVLSREGAFDEVLSSLRLRGLTVTLFKALPTSCCPPSSPKC